MTPEFGNPASALVTGGAKRIGAELSRALAADGWHVHIHCNESVPEAEALAAAIRSDGGSASIVRANLADAGACRTLFDRLEPGKPPVSLIVNNASLFRYDTQADFEAAQWDEQIDVNLRAPALLTQQFAVHCAGRNGLVLNLLDAKVASPNPDFYSYTVSKLGLAGLTDLQARALAPNIRVNGIAPSVTLVSGPQTRENFERAHVYNPLRRGVLVEHIVMTMQYLIAIPTITGQVIVLDAGQRMLGMPRDVAFMVGENA
ncbi:SDR family NAD(P)-dependent oxidoreductase [Sphingosinicella soli]|uniref:NAD(P)-dependent dehydrogenase (Short-subunit alcohol dehydrogenase family) n=1 Tax=Sphingosinicella soli TaxID=333708 RepID=A0A7W7B4U4_9SPHN|nr:SDR family NAD(P)-dependent oxidoreductase [Sphingosinicella soli]MBB4633168.1 NAD(P)-dependent dehydrogenase (short-subunit alcohol dehydrogenase family) [Sphingosinicella soli]